MTAFYSNAAALAFAGKHTRPVIRAMKPWARARNANIVITCAIGTVPTATANGTTIGTATAAAGGYVAPITWTMPVNDGGKFSITTAGVVKTAVAPNITPLGAHNVTIRATDAYSNVEDQQLVITVV